MPLPPLKPVDLAGLRGQLPPVDGVEDAPQPSRHLGELTFSVV